MDRAREAGIPKQHLGTDPKPSKKNIVRTRYGRIEVATAHPFSTPVLGSRTSPYLQSRLVLLGCENVFADVPPLVESLLGITVNQSQVYRVCQAAAEAIEEPVLDAASEQMQQTLDDEQAVVYGMVDGSMLFTEDGWQETKVGRLFGAEAIEDPQQGGDCKRRWELGQSEYVARMGHYQPFTERFERLLPVDSKVQKVFITDGAIWIVNWLKARYGDTPTYILDYYHVKEKLAAVAMQAADPKGWLRQQCDLLLAGGSRAVITAVRELPGIEQQHRDRLLGYLESNLERMDYHLYRARGLMIGSGPVEAAHRTVLQKRMKQSGQRWSDTGAANIIRLRSALLSNKFEIVNNLFRIRAA